MISQTARFPLWLYDSEYILVEQSFSYMVMLGHCLLPIREMGLQIIMVVGTNKLKAEPRERLPATVIWMVSSRQAKQDWVVSLNAHFFGLVAYRTLIWYFYYHSLCPIQRKGRPFHMALFGPYWQKEQIPGLKYGWSSEIPWLHWVGKGRMWDCVIHMRIVRSSYFLIERLIRCSWVGGQVEL